MSEDRVFRLSLPTHSHRFTPMRRLSHYVFVLYLFTILTLIISYPFIYRAMPGRSASYVISINNYNCLNLTSLSHGHKYLIMTKIKPPRLHTYGHHLETARRIETAVDLCLLPNISTDSAVSIGPVSFA